MTLKLADRVLGLKPSATVEMTEKVRAARAAGRRVIGLSSGDPNITTDARIVAAAERALRDGDTHYGPPAGTAALREAVAAREARLSGATYDPADIIITPGGKFALLTSLMAQVEPGDEVLVPVPGWVSYEPCVRLCGGTPVRLDMLDRIDPDKIAAAVTPRTKAIILNSPANPTGRVIPQAELEMVADLARRHDFWIVFDQVYGDLVHDGPFHRMQSIAAVRDRVFVVDSLSKTFGMTGWRLGYLALPPGLAKPVLKFIQHSIYCLPGFVQAAGVEALSLYDELAPTYRALFRARLERAAARLDAIPGIACTVPDAAFYLFPAVDAPDTEVARHWLDTIDVAAMPGSSFGGMGAGHLRLSVTCSDADLDEALDRIARLGLPKAA
ncbi:MAG: aminotransferase class I/II-fold pyridoxal phosphate-dependent enzyme [Rhodoplanes sp.]|uniref:pyridoxal phosphate-dependent aminotransferase n=1 Tax=Rhodoplanes sp. TaxID=1968906 RepID=UPI0017A5A350|nr:aminotransferase class I/II-fold pyridoxal phosphate-dependent enzyme [Rhodoplanes sp.]NVO15532.1 aminotransferase class I/II-fold pyridoxal phosphate-dependent enzyme [Rhodoplanes sp.]